MKHKTFKQLIADCSNIKTKEDALNFDRDVKNSFESGKITYGDFETCQRLSVMAYLALGEVLHYPGSITTGRRG